MDTEALKKRYLNDAEFHSLVNVLIHMMFDAKITPAEVRDATFIAGLKLHDLTSYNKFVNKPW